MSWIPRGATSVAARVASSVLFLSCASTAANSTPGSSSAASAIAAPSADTGQSITPPDGSKRIPSSLNCEPEPDCEGCVVVKGEQARHVGSLDKEVIRAVIRGHLSEVKTCYDAIATTRPDAAGKMMVRFGISASGRVPTSCLVSSELRELSVEHCVVDLPLTWSFPKPEGGGWVVVSYPFVFTR